MHHYDSAAPLTVCVSFWFVRRAVSTQGIEFSSFASPTANPAAVTSQAIDVAEVSMDEPWARPASMLSATEKRTLFQPMPSRFRAAQLDVAPVP